MMHSLVKSPIRLTLGWTVATAIGYLLGGIVILEMSSYLFGGFAFMGPDLTEIESSSATVGVNIGYLALMGAAFGLVVGSCQWLLLRQMQRSAAQWLIVSSLGTTLAFVITPLICTLIMANSSTIRFGCQGPSYNPLVGPLEFNPILTGALVGAVQWIYLRRWLPFAALWIPASAISGHLLILMYTLSFGAVMSLVCAVGVPVFLAVPSSVTALLLGWLWSKSEAYTASPGAES